MLQGPSEFNFSIYISSEDEDGRKELAVRPVNKEAIIKAVTDLKLEGEWRIQQTACGLIVSFMREEDLNNFQELDLSETLGVNLGTVITYSALNTYRQKVLIRDMLWTLPTREIQEALLRQGVEPISITRTRNGNAILEITDPMQYNMLMQDGFDFYSSARFATVSLPNIQTLPAPPARPEMLFNNQRDAVLQCYRCQGFWHYAAQCPGTQRCVRCGEGHAVNDCPRPRNDPVCVHCSGRHHAAYKQCPVRLQMRAFVPIPPVYLGSPASYLPLPSPPFAL